LEQQLKEKNQQIELKTQQDEENIKDGEIEAQSFEASTRFVEEGKKNLALSRKVLKAKSNYIALSNDVAHGKKLLSRAMGRKEDVPYEHLAELVEEYENMVAEQLEQAEETKDEDGRKDPTSTEDRQELLEAEQCIESMQVRQV